MTTPESIIGHHTSHIARPPFYILLPFLSALRSRFSALRSRTSDLGDPTSDFRFPASLLFPMLAALALSTFAVAQERPDAPLPRDPPELAALRAQFEQRREVVLRPIREQHARQIEMLIQSLLNAQRPQDALTVQRYANEFRRSGTLPEMPADAPVELANQRNAYITLADNAERPVKTVYAHQLNALHAAFSRRGDVVASVAISRELQALQPPPSEKSPPDWEKERARVKYQYEHKRFYVGTFDYSDTSRNKLTDGIIGTIPSANTVGWRDTPAQRIRFEFSRPVAPSRVRIYMFGGGRWNMHVCNNIRVLSGEAIENAKQVGHIAKPEDKTGWIEIPLRVSRPDNIFWIEFSSSENQFVLIDEITWE